METNARQEAERLIEEYQRDEAAVYEAFENDKSQHSKHEIDEILSKRLEALREMYLPKTIKVLEELHFGISLKHSRYEW